MGWMQLQDSLWRRSESSFTLVNKMESVSSLQKPRRTRCVTPTIKTMGHRKTLNFSIINRANKNNRAVYWRRQGKRGCKHVPVSNLSTTAHCSFPLPSIQFHSLTSASHSISYPEPREIHCTERELHFDSRIVHTVFS